MPEATRANDGSHDSKTKPTSTSSTSSSTSAFASANASATPPSAGSVTLISDQPIMQEAVHRVFGQQPTCVSKAMLLHGTWRQQLQRCLDSSRYLIVDLFRTGTNNGSHNDRTIGSRILDYVLEAMIRKMSFMIMAPTGAKTWHLESMARLMSLPSTYTSKISWCSLGAVVDGRPLRQTSKIVSNVFMPSKTCQCDPNVEH